MIRALPRDRGSSVRGKRPLALAHCQFDISICPRLSGGRGGGDFFRCLPAGHGAEQSEWQTPGAGGWLAGHGPWLCGWRRGGPQGVATWRVQLADLMKNTKFELDDDHIISHH